MVTKWETMEFLPKITFLDPKIHTLSRKRSRSSSYVTDLTQIVNGMQYRIILDDFRAIFFFSGP